jgi:hypothetical protein
MVDDGALGGVTFVILYSNHGLTYSIDSPRYRPQFYAGQTPNQEVGCIQRLWN